MALEFFDAAGNATANSIFIPVSDLTGLMAEELESGDSTESKNAGFVYSFLKQLRSAISETSYLADQSAGNYLGMALSSADAAPGSGLHSVQFSVTSQLLVNKSAKSVTMIPLNGTDDGMLAFTDVFPNAVKVAEAGAVAGAGVCIPSSDIEAYSSPAYAGLTLANDCRQTITAILSYFYNEIITLRATGVVSAFTARTRQNSIIAFPTNVTEISGITANNQLTSLILSEVLNFVIELLIKDDETLSPNVI